MTLFAYKFVAGFLIAIMLSVTNICPCAMADESTTAQGPAVMPCCRHDAGNKTPSQNRHDMSCKQCSCARIFDAGKPAQLEVPASHYILFASPPMLVQTNLALLARPNKLHFSETLNNSSRSLLRLHCALLV